MPIAHAQFTCKFMFLFFACDGRVVRGACRILLNPLSGGSLGYIKARPEHFAVALRETERLR